MSSPDLVSSTLSMLVALAVVLAVMMVALYGMKRLLGRNAVSAADGGEWIQVRATRYLGLKKSLMLVQVPGAVLVLGVTSDRLSLLATLDEPLPDVTRAADDPDHRGPGRFSDHLQHWTRKIRPDRG